MALSDLYSGGGLYQGLPPSDCVHIVKEGSEMLPTPRHCSSNNVNEFFNQTAAYLITMTHLYILELSLMAL